MSEALNVVLEIGHGWTRVGFGGEANPRVVVRTPSFVFNNNDNGSANFQKRIGAFIKNLFVERLQLNNIRCNIIIVEGISSSLQRELRDSLISCFFLKTASTTSKLKTKQLLIGIHVNAVTFIPLEVCSALICSFHSNCLVVDVGFSHIDIVPILNGEDCLCSKIIVSGLKSSKNGISTALFPNLWSLIQWSNQNQPPNLQQHLQLAESLLSTFEQQTSISSFDGSFAAIIQSGTRDTAINQFASGINTNEENGENDSVCDLIIQSLLHCPMDLRRELAKNIVRIGGGWMIPGVSQAVVDSLKRKLTKEPKLNALSEKFSFAEMNYNSAFIGWIGASTLANNFSSLMKWITENDYNKPNFEFPDWSSLHQQQTTIQNNKQMNQNK